MLPFRSISSFDYEGGSTKMQSSRSNNSSNIRGKNQVEIYEEMLVEELNISEALARRLCNRGIITVGQLLTMSVEEVKGYWIGEKSIQKIQTALMEIGLQPLGRFAPRQKIHHIE